MSSPPSILFVGNLVDVKAPDRALAAFIDLARSHLDLRLDIVGDGPLRASLTQHAQKLQLADHVTFHGRQSPDAVADMMRQASCLLLTSRSEGMPNVVIEALACGTPVVATAVGEVPFLINDGENGFCIDVTSQTPDDEPAIVQRLTEALKKAVSQNWHKQKIAGSVDGFTWRAAAETIVEVVGRIR